MPSIPLQFVCALLLIVLFIRLLRRDGGPPSRMFMVMLAFLIAQTVLHGLRWGYGVTTFFWPLQPILAAIVPPLTWIGFSTLTTSDARRTRGGNFCPTCCRRSLSFSCCRRPRIYSTRRGS